MWWQGANHSDASWYRASFINRLFGRIRKLKLYFAFSPLVFCADKYAEAVSSSIRRNP
jgi:hypothetical protein